MPYRMRGTLGGNSNPSEPPVVTNPIEKFSGYFSLINAGNSSAPTATIVMPLPPVNVVKKADAIRQTAARPPGIQPSQERESSTSRCGVPASASR